MKRRSTKRMPAGLRRYWNKKQRKGKKHSHSRKAHPVAKKKRRHHKKARRSHRRHSSSGGLFPNRHEMYTLGGAAAYGWLEAKAAADPTFLLNKIPRPIAQLGYAGNIALAGRIIHKYAFKNEWVKRISDAAGLIAAYKIGKSGSLFSQADTIEGDNYMEGDDELDAPDMGALSAEGEMAGDDDMEGVPYDDAVEA